MRIKKPAVLFLFFFGLFHIQLHAEGPKPESELLKRLRALTGVVEVRETRFDSALFKEAYEVMIEQPLDHQNPSSERFRQRFWECKKNCVNLLG